MKKLSSILVLIFCLIPFVASAWILRDEFTTPLAAGSVHGTTSEPSGHTRTVTDTENKISIADGKLTFSGGKESPTVGDPAIWYPAIDRVAGRMLMLDYAASSQLYSHFGFDNDQTTSTGVHIFGMHGDKTYFSVGSAYVHPYTNDSSYKLSSILRAKGQFAFLSENNASWKLMWIKASSTITPLYPNISNHSSTFTSSFIRIPTTLWLPTPLASDGFSVSGTTDGKGHAEGVAGGIGEGGGGLAWQSGGTTWSVSEGKAVNTPTVGATLWDTGADTFESGTYGWIKYGNNIVENDNGKLKITYVDNGSGAYNALKEQYSDLSQDLTIGQWYMFTADMMTAQAAQGEAVYIYDGNTMMNVTWMTSNTMTPYNISFRALSTNGSVVYIRVMETGDVFYMDNISLKPLTLSELVNTVQTSTQDVIATINTPTSQCTGVWGGVALNVDSATDPQNMVIGLTNTYSATLTKMVNGVWTEVISGNIKWVSGAELRVIKDGTTYRLYYNYTLVGTATISDASIINNTRHGLFSTDSANTPDNFTLYARGTGGEYTVLDGLMNYEVPFPGGNPPAGGLTLINAGN